MDKQACVILFADLADSVKLYASIGDEAAKTHVLELQHLLEEEVASFGGKVQEIIGDEIMVRFALSDKALPCSIALHRKAQRYSKQHAIPMSLRIGMHMGSVIEDHEENRLFGDTINVAARVTAIAQADQTIITEALLNNAAATWHDAARRFDTVTLKGVSAPVMVYDLPWQQDGLTAIMTLDNDNYIEEIATLTLSHEGKRISLKAHDGIFSIGRAITNTLVIDADPVSRRHVTIERVRDLFVLTDKSTNGTHLFTHTGETLYLRRQQWPMSGSGELALGASREHGTYHVIQFECGTSKATG